MNRRLRHALTHALTVSGSRYTHHTHTRDFGTGINGPDPTIRRPAALVGGEGERAEVTEVGRRAATSSPPCWLKPTPPLALRTRQDELPKEQLRLMKI